MWTPTAATFIITILFLTDKEGNPAGVAGVPPDYYFSADGQLWGNPLYDYEKWKATDLLGGNAVFPRLLSF